MLTLRPLLLVASSILTLAAAAPTELQTRQTWTPGTLNNTREFIIRMTVTDGPTKYTQWALEAYHTGAALADPVFTNATGSRAYLNGTHLQFDLSPYAAGAYGFPSDTNYARWEPVGINAGYGSGTWKNEGPNGLVVTEEEFDGWLVCEWFHGLNAPQLFQMIKGFDGGPSEAYNVPSSCSRVLLFPEFI